MPFPLAAAFSAQEASVGLLNRLQAIFGEVNGSKHYVLLQVVGQVLLQDLGVGWEAARVPGMQSKTSDLLTPNTTSHKEPAPVKLGVPRLNNQLTITSPGVECAYAPPILNCPRFTVMLGVISELEALQKPTKHHMIQVSIQCRFSFSIFHQSGDIPKPYISRYNPPILPACPR